MTVRKYRAAALRVAERLDWIDLALLAGCLIAGVANAAAGAWIVLPAMVLVAVVIVRASWWRTEFEAECESHDFTQHQLDEAGAEVRRLSGDVVRWADFGGGKPTAVRIDWPGNGGAR